MTTRLRTRLGGLTLGLGVRLAEWLAPELVERLCADRARALESARRAEEWAAEMFTDRRRGEPTP